MPHARHALFLCVLTLLCVGVLAVNSATMSVSDGPGVTLQSIIFSRSSAYMALAVCAMLVASRLPMRRVAEVLVARPWVGLIIPALLVMLFLPYVPGIAHVVNGSARWIRIPGTSFTFQPSEFAKWGVPLVLAWHGARRAAVMHRFKDGLLPGLIIIALIAGLVTKEDLGTGLLIAASATVVLIASGARVAHFAWMIPFGLVGIAGAIITSPYRVRRVVTFIDPYADPDGAGYHVIQSLVAIANGNGYGRGLGFGLQKFGYLPEDETDFIFAIICEEMGIVGALTVMLLYLGVIFAGWSIARRQESLLLKLFAIGVLATFAMQAVMNLMVVTGLAPTKGIALPLLSSGGTGWVLTCASLGVLMAMDRIERPQTEPAAAPTTAYAVAP
ncbi:MAG: cell division protein FtsW [Phycisphaerales bacterium]|nr:cell division protein FtsW [Phycisphaerales bacterium]